MGERQREVGEKGRVRGIEREGAREMELDGDREGGKNKDK